jgi:hypothetical protein
MPQKESLEYLEHKLGEQIDGFDSSRQFFRRQQFLLVMATAVLSALTTVLIASEKIFKLEFLTVIALVCSSLITVLAAFDQFLRSRDFWVQKTDTWMALQNLRANLEYAKAKLGNLTQEEIDKFYDRFDKILMSEHEAWKKVRANQSASSKLAGKR